MFAIIKSGGKQYKVSAGDVVAVEKIVANVGDDVMFDEVLFLESDDGEIKIGAPVVPNASIKATVMEHCREDKVIVFKKHARKNYRRKLGHRQPVTKVRIIGIK
ncbi:50S ribosomal protein L21 [Candidatus Sneabacter namystus]|uniref:Large ribosomal subunit protein bL21 n=1 Tax=Candidatus Sneabacter namystus TaxID=2601646 RepID=A0A5C0UK88_9RICK|nr:50S ribosomal protein L21 [Candidatus Sneabacter namystus]QEK39852.1 50S ribosomal protein L21 [Candidatus Sneabacter namystus]